MSTNGSAVPSTPMPTTLHHSAVVGAALGLLPHHVIGEVHDAGGIWPWAKQHPVKATAIVGMTALSSDSGMAGDAARQFHSIIQPAQFG